MSKNDDMIKLVRLFEGTQFAGEPEQKPGDQVRGTDKAVVKGRQHPFHNRLVGEEISLEDKLSKRYQDMKDVQVKEKEQKKKEESDKQDVSEVSDTTLKNYKRTSAGDVINRQNIANWNRVKDPKIAKRNAGQERAEKKLQGVAEGVGDVVTIHQHRQGSDMGKYGTFNIERETPTIIAVHDHNTGEMLKFNRATGRGIGSASQLMIKQGVAEGSEKHECPHCLGSGRMVRDPDIGTDQECFVCDGTGYVNDEQGVAEGFGGEDSPASQAIARRIMMQRTDLLSKYGPVKVMAAIDEVADFVGDVDEIGSSDVSGWIRHVEQMLGNMEQGVAESYPKHQDLSGISTDKLKAYLAKQSKQQTSGEGNQVKRVRAELQRREQGVGEAAPSLVKGAAGLALGGLAAAGAPALVGILGPLLGIPFAAYGAYTAAKLGMKGVEKLWDMAAEKLGGEDQVTQYTNAKIAKLPPDQAQAAAQVVKSVAESRRAQGGTELAEVTNPADKITLDVPLMIRIMEYAREDAKDDVDLHNVAEQLVRLSSMGKTLGMNDYDGIVGMTTEQKLSELGAVPPTPPTPPQGTAASSTTPTSGSVSPDEQTALNKIQTNPAMKQQFDKLMTQATPGAANKPAVLDPEQADALEKIKTNAGLKGQYDRLIKQANPTATP